MVISKIKIRNFRILLKSTFDFNQDLCLMIGRNNTGKTSFMVLFEKFLHKLSFDFNDFSVGLRKEILEIDKDTDVSKLAIQLILNIKYDAEDDLSNLSEFIIDLDPDRLDVNILFECSIDKDKLLEGLAKAGNISKEKYISKYLGEYLVKNVYTFDNIEDLKTVNRYRLIKKDFKDVDKLIDFDIIHAKRSVSSSEEKRGAKVLSGLTTSFFNNAMAYPKDKFEDINIKIDEMDASLTTTYEEFFDSFLKNAKDFLSMQGLRVISNLKANEILSDSSEVVYGDNTKQLPEYLNGLGHMNVLYLLLDIEIKKTSLLQKNKDIKLLFIEEPEAHTHPQLQYIFARKISSLFSGIKGFQTIISTHSPHIVSKHPFSNIRYMLNQNKGENSYIAIINFYKELEEKYSSQPDLFLFLQQYLSIESAELFFSDKVIFIEGISENILINNFISIYDNIKINEDEEKQKKDSKYKLFYTPLSSQNLTILQVGANAKAFRYFLELLNIPSLIITDIDTAEKIEKNKKTYYKAINVESPTSCYTSNATIKYYYGAPEVNTTEFDEWYKKLLSHELSTNCEQILVTYQNKENDYYSRSFEDSFISLNLELIKKHADSLWGIKNAEDINTEVNMYELTSKIIDKKSDFAASLLFLFHTKGVVWNTPNYIMEGIEWLQKQTN
ncbi:MAG: ATP-dependent endonuclease [Firmicutes bacterium HGW-Firmicutes-7]|nr:MAG: ATP-dependent endonuclease [Firmicutes bacterium HGW-Firmicutes-7]